MPTYLSYPVLAGLQYPVAMRPLFSQAVQTTASGLELVADFWLGQFKWEFSLSYEFLRTGLGATQELKKLIGFFLAVRGAPFLFDPREDKTKFGATGQLLGTGDGSEDTFQLVNNWDTYFAEPVKYIHTAPNVYVDGVLINPSYYTVNSAGAVVFAPGHIPASGKAVTADFSWDYLVRFAHEGKGGSSNASSNLASVEVNSFMLHLWEGGQVDLITWFE